MHNLLIITGGSRGIGHASITQFLQQGWKVINISRQLCEHKDVTTLQIDLSSQAWQENLEQPLIAACQAASKVCLIHNAAYYVNDTIKSVSYETLSQSLNLNVIVPALLSKMLIPYMKLSSSIIYIGSTLSEKAVMHNLSYTTSKHAVAGLMKATCQDLVGTHIHTCCICPGITDTEMVQERCKNNPKLLEMLKNISSEKRLIQPEEIADVVWFAANHAVINGAVLHANLGQIEH